MTKLVKHEYIFEMCSPDGKAIEYTMVISFTPGIPANITARMEDSYPAEGAELDSVEVYYRNSTPCKATTHGPDHTGIGEGGLCPFCKGMKYIKVNERRKELDDILTDEQLYAIIDEVEPEESDEPDLERDDD
jgi:hypothetical protein